MPFLVLSSKLLMWQVGLLQPLSMFGDLYGWGSGPIIAPRSGTQSWLLCPLISMALALHATDALSNQFLAFFRLVTLELWHWPHVTHGVRGDNLQTQLQEAVQKDVMSMLTVWLSESVSVHWLSITARNTNSLVQSDVVSQFSRSTTTEPILQCSSDDR